MELKSEIPDCWLLMAEGHLSRRLFGSMLRMIPAVPLTGRRDFN